MIHTHHWLTRCLGFLAALILLSGLLPGSVRAELVIDEDVPPLIIDRTTDPYAWSDFSFPDGAKLLDIWMPDIRDADAALLTYDGAVWMIDCGDERAAKRVVLLLRQLGVDHIDMLFNSHPHHDHLNGLEMVDDVAKVAELLVCFPHDASTHIKRAMVTCEERDIAVADYGDGEFFSMGADGGVTFRVMMKTAESRSMNDRSAQIMVSLGDRRMLFTGDMEHLGQRDLLAAIDAGTLDRDDLKADILKYPHHGKLDLVDEYLSAVSPQLCVITNYRRFGDSWYYLSLHHVNMVYTNRDSIFLHLVTDGEHWIAEYVPIQK